ncbi:3'(2'),5'-bisphosphate nucleotidase CysQ [Halosquirtibacter laminarini]|uniref:3'(2'),5'-bisphosphate nucleotidase CysQ n=1 Tax=Halosquirtibacter laminarini TaxID=3374600 RepID=A0AC61NBE3_9BACT|nr:3'(2'),5'-bisphosphate nucleotidase CysQ [Prolixibacteraceae bacterium]
MTENTFSRRMTLLAMQAALRGGKEIHKIYRRNDLEVDYKEDHSPVTIADKKASEVICDILSLTNIPVLSEEEQFPSYQERKDWDYLWIIDPLDGTKEFIKRNNDFTVNIALVHRGRPVLGIIYIPIADILYYGNIDEGAYMCKNAHKMDPEEILQKAISIPTTTLRDKYTVVGSKSHMNEDTRKFFDQVIQERGEENTQIIHCGSSIKMCMVAEGKADIYPRCSNIMEWDIAAGHAICEAAGCIVTKFDGSPLEYNKKEFKQPWFVVKREV